MSAIADLHLAATLAFLAVGCGGASQTVVTESDPEGMHFVDVTTASGLGSFEQVSGSPEKAYVYEALGAGVALFDADGDGRLDAYLTNGGVAEAAAGVPAARDALFLNRGDLSFEEVTEELGLGHPGWTMGAYATDLDADGRVDLYLTAWGENVLYLRDVDGGFGDVTARAGVGDERWSTGAAFLDHDRDGDLDLYVANYVVFDAANPPTRYMEYRGLKVHFGPRGMPGEPDAFFRNLGDGTFEDATAAVGVEDSEAYGFEVVAFDHDEDGFCDLYVGNDSTPNYLWRNERGERFVNTAFQSGAALSKGGMEQAGMGVCVGDADGDLRFDLYVTNFSEDYHTFYRNDGGGFFRDATLSARLAMATMDSLGWACGMVDLDSDGDLDIFAANGHVYPQVDEFDFGTRYLQRNQLFEQVAAGRFQEVTETAGPGFGVSAVTRGGAAGDLDGDGDPDLLFGNLDGAPTLLRNDSDQGAWVLIRLVGGGGNRPALGAVVTVTAAGRTQVVASGHSSGFLSTSDSRLHVGLGAAERVEEVEVRWPDGARESYADLPVRCLLTLTQGDPEATSTTLP